MTSSSSCSSVVRTSRLHREGREFNPRQEYNEFLLLVLHVQCGKYNSFLFMNEYFVCTVRKNTVTFNIASRHPTTTSSSCSSVVRTSRLHREGREFNPRQEYNEFLLLSLSNAEIQRPCCLPFCTITYMPMAVDYLLVYESHHLTHN